MINQFFLTVLYSHKLMHVVYYFGWRSDQIHDLNVQLEKEEKHMYMDVDLKPLNHVEDSEWKRI